MDAEHAFLRLFGRFQGLSCEPQLRASSAARMTHARKRTKVWKYYLVKHRWGRGLQGYHAKHMGSALTCSFLGKRTVVVEHDEFEHMPPSSSTRAILSVHALETSTAKRPRWPFVRGGPFPEGHSRDTTEGMASFWATTIEGNMHKCSRPHERCILAFALKNIQQRGPAFRRRLVTGQRYRRHFERLDI